jgi:hypothetical protein
MKEVHQLMTLDDLSILRYYRSATGYVSLSQYFCRGVVLNNMSEIQTFGAG